MICNAAFCSLRKLCLLTMDSLELFSYCQQAQEKKKKEKFLAVPSVDGGIKIGLQWACGKGELCFVFQ